MAGKPEQKETPKVAPKAAPRVTPTPPPPKVDFKAEAAALKTLNLTLNRDLVAIKAANVALTKAKELAEYKVQVALIKEVILVELSFTATNTINGIEGTLNLGAKTVNSLKAALEQYPDLNAITVVPNK
jgi:hypothetical protein